MSWRFMPARLTITRCPELIEDWTMVDVYDDGAAWSAGEASAGRTREGLCEELRMMLQAAEGGPFFDLDTHKVVTPAGAEVAP